MEENGYRFGVGVLVLSSFLIGILLVVFFGAVPRLWTRHYSVTINFKTAPGVRVDTPVRKNGVQIGRIASIKLLPGDGGVNLGIELDEEHQIFSKEICKISSGSLITGEAMIEFVKETPVSLIDRFDGVGGSPKDGLIDPQETLIAESPIKNGDYLKGGIAAGDPMNVVVDLKDAVANVLASVDLAAKRVDSLGATFQEAIGGGTNNIQAVVDKTKQALDNFNLTADSIRRVLNQAENSRVPDAIAKFLERLPGFVDEAEEVVKQTKSTLKSFEQVGDNFQDVGKEATNLVKDVREVTDPLKEEAKRVVGTASRTLDNLDYLVKDLRKFTTRLNNSEGTVSKLLDDPQLYYTVVGTFDNVERVTRQLQPVMNDVRIFTDKVSRDPSAVVGLRGLINGKPQGAGLK